ncbi:MAG TPA: hypothetical protein VGN74_05405 [Brevundimonas sp.]|jgi:hypothetical protein|uniref:hypothetical protein n=1 Tax=Brevundimonas sp. TaxID=1871086 RepID=UPI002E1252AC|nr:hypothetical protein [Brevundimonas sp.]
MSEQTRDDLVERLRRVKYVREGRDDRDYVCDVDCEADDYGARAVPYNPDGPEAADRIERLERALRSFVAHYPMGVNPFLDQAYRNARAALQEPGQ